MAPEYGTVQDVRNMASVESGELQDSTIASWMDWVASEINARLPNGSVGQNDARYDAIVGIAVRKTVDLVGVARTRAETAIIDTGEFEVEQLATGDFFRSLKSELEPHMNPNPGDDVELYSSSGWDSD